jgi:hypothetical protein
MNMQLNKVLLAGSLIILTAGFFTSTALYASGNAAAPQDDELTRTETFDVSPGGELYVRTSGGSIKVEGGNGNRVTVEMRARSSRYSEDRIREELEKNFKISIQKSGNRVEAIAERNSSWTSGWGGVSVSFVVRVPSEFNCDLNTSGGSLELRNVGGREQKMKTSGGSITLADVRGLSNVNTSGGSISATNHTGDLKANTSGGSIRISQAQGNLDLHTSGGSIRIEQAAGTVRANTSGGGITADIARLGSELSLHTSGGSIDATIPSGSGLDLDLKGSRVNVDLNNFSGQAERDRVVGSMNGGGVPIRLSTSGGSVSLRTR